jgi:hypothetical protein
VGGRIEGHERRDVGLGMGLVDDDLVDARHRGILAGRGYALMDVAPLHVSSYLM